MNPHDPFSPRGTTNSRRRHIFPPYAPSLALLAHITAPKCINKITPIAVISGIFARSFALAFSTIRIFPETLVYESHATQNNMKKYS